MELYESVSSRQWQGPTFPKATDEASTTLNNLEVGCTEAGPLADRPSHIHPTFWLAATPAQRATEIIICGRTVYMPQDISVPASQRQMPEKDDAICRSGTINASLLIAMIVGIISSCLPDMVPSNQ